MYNILGPGFDDVGQKFLEKKVHFLFKIMLDLYLFVHFL